MALSGGGDADESFDIDTKVQMSGVLLKQPFGHKSKGKWQRRFFIIKEGFILYYGETEKRSFERSHHFNIHPKGVIPLGGCTVKQESESGDKTKFPLIVEHRDFKGKILLAAENAEERDKWIDMIRNSGRVTWKNAQLGDAMIHQLEQESRKMAEQQEKVKDLLHNEATALAEEKGKKEDLEKQAADLAREKLSIEEQLAKFKEDKEVTMSELQGTLETLRQVKQDKEHITQSLQSLQDRFTELNQEKELTASQLEERNRIASQLLEEKERLASQTQSLTETLQTVESAKEKLAREHQLAEELLLKESEEKQKIEKERKRQSLIVQEKEELIKIVEQEKKAKEKAYLVLNDTEKRQRVATEKRLRLAEDSLKRVDRALRESGINLDIEIELDVQNLRKFFEEAAEEARLDAEKPRIMKDAVLARTSYVRKSGIISGSPETSPLIDRKAEQEQSAIVDGSESLKTDEKKEEKGDKKEEEEEEEKGRKLTTEHRPEDLNQHIETTQAD